MATTCHLSGHSGPGRPRKWLTTVMVALPMVCSTLVGQRAEAQGSAANTTGTGTKTNGRASAVRQQSLKQITSRLSQSTGVQVLVDSILSRQMLVPDVDSVTVKTLDDYLTRVLRRLPPGSAVLKIYLPAFAETQRVNPDAVAQLAWAQRDLQRDLLGRLVPDTVYIQGKTLSAAEAEPLIATLGLKPVYVLTHRQAPPPGASSDDPADPSNLITSMTKYLKGVTDELMKQVGVTDVKDIPNGSYEITLPGDDGPPKTFTVEVGGTEGASKQITFKSSSSSSSE